MTLPYCYCINKVYLTTIHNHASHFNSDTYIPHDMMIMLPPSSHLLVFSFKGQSKDEVALPPFPGAVDVNHQLVVLAALIQNRREALERIVGEGDRNCIWVLRMNINAFANLCELLQVQEGLKEDGHVRFCRSRETISKYFNKVLMVVIRIQSILFSKATLVEENCLDPTWRRFK
ncbi:hypothetical protein HN51_062143, partial [Arachis hypogaea]